MIWPILNLLILKKKNNCRCCRNEEYLKTYVDRVRKAFLGSSFPFCMACRVKPSNTNRHFISVLQSTNLAVHSYISVHVFSCFLSNSDVNITALLLHEKKTETFWSPQLLFQNSITFHTVQWKSHKITENLSSSYAGGGLSRPFHKENDFYIDFSSHLLSTLFFLLLSKMKKKHLCINKSLILLS